MQKKKQMFYLLVVHIDIPCMFRSKWAPGTSGRFCLQDRQAWGSSQVSRVVSADWWGTQPAWSLFSPSGAAATTSRNRFFFGRTRMALNNFRQQPPLARFTEFNILCEASARLLKESSFYLRGQGLHLSTGRIFGDIFELLQSGICQY